MARVDESITQFAANEQSVAAKTSLVLFGVKLVFLSVREFMFLN